MIAVQTTLTWKIVQRYIVQVCLNLSFRFKYQLIQLQPVKCNALYYYVQLMVVGQTGQTGQSVRSPVVKE